MLAMTSVKLVMDNVIAGSSYIDQLGNLGEDAFTQFIFDNVDWNRRNDTGKDSFLACYGWNRSSVTRKYH